MQNDYRATVTSHVGPFGSIPCRTATVEDGHLVITGWDGIIAVFAPGSWNAVRVDPAVQNREPEAG
ncbi:hypothetical protein M673_12515 [Aureimonas sp. AU20]|nr:hypothetical protein M673_12515 [Aureimonas sp. AU20]